MPGLNFPFDELEKKDSVLILETLISLTHLRGNSLNQILTTNLCAQNGIVGRFRERKRDEQKEGKNVGQPNTTALATRLMQSFLYFCSEDKRKLS